MTWTNWARTASSSPAVMTKPRTEEQVAAVVQRAAREGRRVKAVGASHSFTDIAGTDGVMVSLDHLSGVIAVDGDEVTFAAGTRLHQVAALLAPHGLALPNMGDIDRQSIGGVISTATHGTGLRFTGFAGTITALRIVLASGEIVDCSATERPELFHAARVGLGAFGIIVRVRLRCVPAYVLHAVEGPEPLDAVLESFVERARREDHLEFFWFPGTRDASVKTNTRLPASTPLKPVGRIGSLVSDEIVGNAVFRGLCEVGRRVPQVVPAVNRLAARAMSRREYIDTPPHVYVSSRRVRFTEMEYAMPLEAFDDVMADAIDAVNGFGGRTASFPLEVRTAASDDAWLSTGYGRQSVYVAVHRFLGEPYRDYFAAVERVLRDHGGRPHWGKLHTLGSAELAGLYPKFADALAVRDEVDPNRLFGNAYLERVLGT